MSTRLCIDCFDDAAHTAKLPSGLINSYCDVHLVRLIETHPSEVTEVHHLPDEKLRLWMQGWGDDEDRPL